MSRTKTSYRQNTPGKRELTRGMQIFGLACWLAVTFGAAAAGAFASRNAQDFYLNLVRPEWAPPPWVFAPVWSVLYLMMGVAAWLVWREKGLSKGFFPLALYVVQLGANALWTWLFFAWHRGAFASGEVLILCALVLCTLVAFWRVRPLAGVLMIPYLAWVGFASALTYAVWKSNPAVLG